jgi:hypothetical protein
MAMGKAMAMAIITNGHQDPDQGVGTRRRGHRHMDMAKIIDICNKWLEPVSNYEISNKYYFKLDFYGILVSQVRASGHNYGPVPVGLNC